MIGILASRADVASTTIARELLDVAGVAAGDELAARYELDGAELVVVDDLHIELEAVDDRFEADPRWIAVVSRHAGDTGPLLTVHTPGNIDGADFGGTARTVPPACPNALRAYRRAIEAHAPAGYGVGIECTHHGPTDVEAPIMFVEIGSDREQWTDTAAAASVATALWSIRDEPAHRSRQLVGLGGGHYAPRFDRIMVETDWAVGHIAPDWGLEDLGPSALEAVLPGLFEASQTTLAVIDGDRPALTSVVEALGYRVVSERWLRATSQLSEAVVDALEARIAPLSAGLELGDRTETDPSGLRFVDLSPRLLAACDGIDSEATETAVSSATVAYAHDPTRTYPYGRLALAQSGDLDRLVADLVAVLEQRADDVDRRPGVIVARRRQFDPAAAAAAGVEEGPQFGRLASGEPVTVDGTTVDPADVTRDRIVTYELPPDV